MKPEQIQKKNRRYMGGIRARNCRDRNIKPYRGAYRT